MHPLSKDILTFWFGTTDLTVEIEKRPVWFKSTSEFDQHLIDHYADIHEQAAAGALDHLRETPTDCLSLILALDQLPRNIFRGTARAFATDAKALDVALHAVTQGFDAVLPAGRGPSPICRLSIAKTLRCRIRAWSISLRSELRRR